MKQLLLAVLLVAVYQFDELRELVRRFWARLNKRRYGFRASLSDPLVGTVLAMVGLPLLLGRIMEGEQGLLTKLVWLGLAYFLFAVAAYGAVRFAGALRRAAELEGWNLVFASFHTLAGLLHPSFSFLPWQAGPDRLPYAKLAFLLSLPALFGILLKTAAGDIQVSQTEAHFDALLVVMVGGVSIRLTIAALENYFRRHQPTAAAGLRIAVGLGVLLVLAP